MTFPVAGNYPIIENPAVARASAALAAAGAWDATPLVLNIGMVNNVALHFTYTRGGAGGAFDFQIQFSPYGAAADVPAGAQEWIMQALYAPGAVAAGADADSNIQREYIIYQATGAAVEAFTYGPVSVAGVYNRMRVRARESGNVGAPGTLQVTATVL